MSELSLSEKIIRIERTKHFWMKYQLAEKTLQLLEDRLNEPQTHRMRNVLIVADTNGGKTRLILRFLRQHRAVVRLSEPSVVPILNVQATQSNEGEFLNRILEALPVYKNGQTARADMKEILVVRALKNCQIRMLIIDEFQEMLLASTSKQNSFRRLIKSLGNQLMIPIVALGTREAFHGISSDPQLANRFQVVALPRWSLDGPTKDKPSEYRQFLAAFERLLPFERESELGQDPMAQQIHFLSDGTIGETTDLLRDAAIWAVRNGRECISKEALDNCDFVPPSRRTVLKV